MAADGLWARRVAIALFLLVAASCGGHRDEAQYDEDRTRAELHVQFVFGGTVALVGSLFWDEDRQCLTMYNTRQRRYQKCGVSLSGWDEESLLVQLNRLETSLEDQGATLDSLGVQLFGFSGEIPAEDFGRYVPDGSPLHSVLANLESVAQESFGRRFDFPVLLEDWNGEI